MTREECSVGTRFKDVTDGWIGEIMSVTEKGYTSVWIFNGTHKKPTGRRVVAGDDWTDDCVVNNYQVTPDPIDQLIEAVDG